MSFMKTLMKEALASSLAAFGAVVGVMYYFDRWPETWAGFVKWALFTIIIVGGGAILSRIRRRQWDTILGQDGDDKKPGD